MVRQRPSGDGDLDRRALLEIRAAIGAGLSVGQAIVTAQPTGALAAVARDVRLGRTLADVAAGLRDCEPAVTVLVRSLAVAELTGAGALAAVDQAIASARDEAALQRLIDVKTADARTSAAILSAIPVGVWVVLAALNPSSLGLYRTLPGMASAVVAAALVLASWRVTRRLVRTAVTAALSADPLAADERLSWRKPLLTGAVAGLAASIAVAPAAGLAVAAVTTLLARRVDRSRAERDAPTRGGSAEAIELVACGLVAGLPVVPALETVARLGPQAARPVVAQALRRVRSGSTLSAAFDGTPLAALGDTLSAAQRWGAPAEETLRRLVADLRADRRAAAEKAAERLQLALVFPTTLLTLPAFVLGVVPPLLWSTLA